MAKKKCKEEYLDHTSNAWDVHLNTINEEIFPIDDPNLMGIAQNEHIFMIRLQHNTLSVRTLHLHAKIVL